MEKIYLSAGPDTVPCERCDSEAKRIFPTSISLMRSEMDNSPIDNAIGKDADKRWENIHNRQELRASVRQKTGKSGLTEVSKNNFVPISEDKVKTRTGIKELLADPPKMKSGSSETKKWLSNAD